MLVPSDHSILPSPLSQTSELFRREAALVIDSMREGSCTNLSGGLFQGVAQQKGGTYLDWGGIAPSADDDDASSSWVMVDDDASSVSSMSSLANHLHDAQLQTPCRGGSGALQSRGKRARRAVKTREIFGGLAAPPAKPVEEDAVRSVFVFTDGMANVGHRDEALVAATKQLIDSETPVRIFAFPRAQASKRDVERTTDRALQQDTVSAPASRNANCWHTG